MFKRLTKFTQKRDKDIAAGIDVSADAPPEALLDEDDDSDTSSSDQDDDDDNDEHDDHDSSNESSSSVDDRDTGQAPKVGGPEKIGTTNGNINAKGKGKKRRLQDDSDDETSDQDDISDASSSSSSSPSSFDNVEAAEPVDLSIPPLSVSQSLESPFYLSPLSPSKAGTPWITCLVCPLSQLKTEHSVEVHCAAKGHARRFARYKKYIEQRLSAIERESEWTKGGADPRGIVKEIEDEVRREQGRNSDGSALKRKRQPTPKNTVKKAKKVDDLPKKGKPRKKAKLNGTSGEEVQASEDSKSIPTEVTVDSAMAAAKALARRERKKVHRQAWKDAKDARRKGKKGATAVVAVDTQKEQIDKPLNGQTTALSKVSPVQTTSTKGKGQAATDGGKPKQNKPVRNKEKYNNKKASKKQQSAAAGGSAANATSTSVSIPTSAPAPITTPGSPSSATDKKRKRKSKSMSKKNKVTSDVPVSRAVPSKEIKPKVEPTATTAIAPEVKVKQKSKHGKSGR